MKKYFKQINGVFNYPVMNMDTKEYNNLYLYCCNKYSNVDQQHVALCYNGLHYGYIACSN